MHSLRVCVCTYVWAYIHVCVRACVCMHMLTPMCMHDFCACVLSFPAVQKCGEEGKKLEGKVMWSVVFQQFIYICVIVKCRVYYS